jgi:molybdenum cofactor biosynthesis protein MoaC
MAKKLSHIDAEGRARMVDVGAKPLMRRTAVAAGEFVAAKATLDLLTGVEGAELLPKGEGLAVARVAGIMATTKCGELIPLCHPLPLDHVQVDFDRTADGPSGLPRWPNYSTACNGGSGGALGGVTVSCGEVVGMGLGSLTSASSAERIDVPLPRWERVRKKHRGLQSTVL